MMVPERALSRMLCSAQAGQGNKVFLVTALHTDAASARAWPSSVRDVSILGDGNEVRAYSVDYGCGHAQRVLFESVLKRGRVAVSPLFAALPAPCAFGHELKCEEPSDGFPPGASRVIAIDRLGSGGPRQTEAPVRVDVPIGAPAWESPADLFYSWEWITVMDPELKCLDNAV